MITYDCLKVPLNTLKECYEEHSLAMFEVSHITDPRTFIGRTTGKSYVDGEIEFQDFSCSWEFYKKARIHECSDDPGSIQENILTIEVIHPKTSTKLCGWVVCSDMADAFNHMKKLSFLYGECADYS